MSDLSLVRSEFQSQVHQTKCFHSISYFALRMPCPTTSLASTDQTKKKNDDEDDADDDDDEERKHKIK